MIEIFIGRHGQNVDNANGILNGHRDLPLTDLGREQARQLAQGILDTGLRFDYIYTSPLQRAAETATIVSAMLGMQQKPIVIEGLIERDFGVMTGKRCDQIAELCSPDIVSTSTITYFLNPKGAETFPELIIRGKRAVQVVCSLQKSGKALLVCHGDIGKMIYAGATNRPWRQVLSGFHFGNGELIDLEPNGEAHIVKLRQYNL